MPPIYQSDFKIAWNDGENSMGEEYDLPSEKVVTELTDDASWITRREHAREKPEKAIRSRRMRKSWLDYEQNCTRRRDIMRRYKWKSRSRRRAQCQVFCTRWTFEHSSPTISSRQIKSYKCESFEQREYIEHWLCRTLADPYLVKSRRNEKAAKFSAPLPKVRGIAEEEMFKVVKTGKKTAKKGIPNSYLLRQNDC